MDRVPNFLILNHVLRLAVFAICVVVIFSSAIAQENSQSSDKDPTDRMEWWQDARFGMFIHWGAYSKAGGAWHGETNHAEWLQFSAKIPLAEYTEYAKTFDPESFNADEWVEIAKNAGMKYLVVTTKHHDGIAMFDSKSSPHNIVKLADLKFDPIKELSEACHKQGIHFCTYYSLGRDWQDPDVPTGSKGKTAPGWRSNLVDYPNEEDKEFSKYFERKVKPQVRELLTNYGPIGVMWFDTPEQITPEQSAELLKLIRSLQPDCIVNARIGNGLGDYGTPEQTIPSDIGSEPWETCMTLNGHWGYNKADDDWKSYESLLRNLIDIVSKGGNYLLNVGPTGEGVIPEPSVERLSEIGKWLSLNGEAIYGCDATPFGQELGAIDKTNTDKKGKPKFNTKWDWRCTTKPGVLYLHLFNWPEDGSFELPGLESEVAKILLLADGRACKFEQSDGILTIDLPQHAPDEIASVIRIEITDDVVKTTDGTD